MNRTAFLVDGFNLYHSLRAAKRDSGGPGALWLDLRSLCASYLHAVGGGAQIESVIYFSALARHLETVRRGVTLRHLAYIGCLEATGVIVRLSQFKQKWLTCPHCLRSIGRHEEKETDVAIATTMLELLWGDQCDTVVLVTGDSDVAPALRAALRCFPDKAVCCFLPYRRSSLELRSLAHRSFLVSREQYLRHQLPDPFRLPDGRLVAKPGTW